MDIDKTLRDLALLASRLALGGSLAAHGAQKLFGIQNGPGLKGTAKMLKSLGFEQGDTVAPLVAASETTAGTLIALGALGPIGPAMLLSIMLVAIETVHRPKGYWNTDGGFEMNTMYVLNALLLANEGYGSYSLDEIFGWREKMRPMHGWIALLGGAAAAMLILGQRTQQSAPKQSPQSETSENGVAQRDPAGAGV